MLFRSWFFEFLTEIVGLDPHKIYVSCFIGDEKNNIPRDDEAAQIWQEVFAKKGIEAKIVELDSAENGDKLGMQGGRIFFYNDKENWWSRGGGIDSTPIGDPCGPDSEMFYDFNEQHHDTPKGLRGRLVLRTDLKPDYDRSRRKGAVGPPHQEL